MHIFLLILKIIGIILLVLLLLFLAVLFIILCTPLRYRVWGQYSDRKPDIHLKVGIWFSAVNVSASYTEEGISAWLKILFYKRKLFGVAPGRQKSPDEDNEWQSLSLEEEEDDLSENEQQTEEPAASEEEQKVIEEQTSPGVQKEILNESDEEEQESHEEQKKKNLTDFLTSFFSNASEKIKSIFEKIRETVNKIIELYHSLVRKKDLIVKFWNLSSTQHVWKVLKKQLFKVIKSVLPKRIEGELKLGLDDPYIMGQICMYLGMFYPAYERYLSFTPVFDEKVLEGRGSLKGRIILGAILVKFLRFLFMRDFYRLLGNFKKLIKKLK